MVGSAAAQSPTRWKSDVTLDKPLVVSQLPADTDDFGGNGNGARLVLVSPDGSARILSQGFHGACDADVSFDGRRILFAGKRTADDDWNIYEMATDGSAVRQITRGLGNCRNPVYQSTLYTIISPKPWRQITFVADDGAMNEAGATVATNLYSCKLDGSAVRRLTYNLSSDADPFLMADGRLLLSSWQRSNLRHGLAGRMRLFGVNLDGADYALFADRRGRRFQHMPCVTAGGLVLFVESDRLPADGAGLLSSVTMRRPLQSYLPLTVATDGLFHSPSPLPDARVLVSRRPADGSGSHGIYRFDPATGKCDLVFDDPRYHEIQAKLVAPRAEPDGRSSVVTEADPNGKLYCLNVYLSDLKREWMPAGTVKRLRVLEGIPVREEDGGAYLPEIDTLPGRKAGSTVNGLPPLAQRRMLGEIDVEADGSFNIEVPANTPIELQVLDADGMALRSCSWIWAKNHEPRGCIGCHEDGELTPENQFRDAMSRESVNLCLPPRLRRTVDFRRDVMPIIEAKCVPCHGPGQATPRLDGGSQPVEHADGKAFFNRAYESLLAVAEPGGGKPDEPEQFRGKYVRPGSARTSPLIWHLFGRNTSRPWDSATVGLPAKPITPKPIPPVQVPPLTDDEKRTFIEWIDMGAMYNGPRIDQAAGE